MPPAPSLRRAYFAMSLGGIGPRRLFDGRLAPAKMTVPFAIERTGSPSDAEMSRPWWRRAPPARSAPGPRAPPPRGPSRGGGAAGAAVAIVAGAADRHARGAFEWGDDVHADRGWHGRVDASLVGADEAASRGQHQILVAAADHVVAPEHVRDRVAVRHAAEHL